MKTMVSGISIAKRFGFTSRHWNELPDATHILYVDDEPGLLDIGKLYLEKSGDFSVTMIGSATAALDLHIKEEFNAIISDYQIARYGR